MDDLISRQAAIDEIKALYEWHDTVTEDRTIDHLKRLPSAEPDVPDTNVGDMISRQAAIDALQKEINKGIPPFDDVMGSIRCGVRLARNIIEDLPSVKPRCIATIQLSQEQLDEAFEKVKTDILSVKPKTGKWTIEDVHSATYKYCCSECKAHHRARYDFCPTCGAKMLEEGGENDE